MAWLGQTTSLWQWGNPTTWNTPPPQVQVENQDLFHLWSPLVIFFLCLAIVLVLAMCGCMCCLLYNLCNFGSCCRPPANQERGLTIWELCCCCCMGFFPAAPATKVVRRGSSSRGRKQRQQIIVEDLPGDDVIVVKKGCDDRKSVRICDSVRSSRSHHRQPIDIDDACRQPAPIPIIIQQVPAPAPPVPQMPAIAPAPSGCQGGCGGGCGCSGGGRRKPASTLNVVIGNASNTNRPNQFVMNMNSSSENGGGFRNSEFTEYRLMPVSEGSYNQGYSKEHEAREHECGSCMSDGQRSAVIDIGHGVYPSLPRYDD